MFRRRGGDGTGQFEERVVREASVTFLGIEGRKGAALPAARPNR
jgi:hypothetical protein